MSFSASGLAELRAVAEPHVGPAGSPGLVALVASRGTCTSRPSGCLQPRRAADRSGTRSSGSPPPPSRSPLRRPWPWSPRARSPWTSRSTAAARAGRPPGAAPDGRAARRTRCRRTGRSPPGTCLTFTFGFGMAAEMFAAAQPWPVVQAAEALAPRHDRPAAPGDCRRSRHLDRRPGLPAAAGAARRARGSTTRCARCSACCSPGRPGCRSPRRCAAGSSSRSACATRASRRGRRAAGHGVPADARRARRLGRAGRRLEPAAGVRGRCGGPGVHRRRPARLRPDAAARWPAAAPVLLAHAMAVDQLTAAQRVRRAGVPGRAQLGVRPGRSASPAPSAGTAAWAPPGWSTRPATWP